MLEIAVVDDEKAIRAYFCKLIKQQEPESHIESYAAGEELLASGRRFDLVLLDIQMDGMNGIETARSLRQRQEKTILIFVTGIKEYVFDALDLYAFHYLLKPVDKRKFAEVLERAAKEVQRKQDKQGLFIKTRNLTLDQSDILYIESRGKKVEIHRTGTKKNIEFYAAMEALERQLGAEFYRCHRGYIVNMDYIAEYGGSSITLINGEQVYLAKKKYSEFVKVYMWHLQNGGVSSV